MFIPDVETEEHAELRTALRRLFEKRSPESEVRTVIEGPTGYDAELWAQMAEQMGLQGLPIAEEFGGAGGGAAELAVVFQELGRGVIPTPYFATVALAATLLQELGEDAADYLGRIAEGDLIATVALSGSDDGWDVDSVTGTAQLTADGWQVTGEWSYVIDGMAADLILVPVRSERGVSVFAIDPADAGVVRSSLETLDLTRRQARVSLDAAPARLIGSEGAAGSALEKTVTVAILALAAEQAGGAEFLMGMTLEYATLRHQFGRPIGAFQAIKHKLAEMVFDLERMKSALRQLVDSVSSEASDAATVAHLTKAFCSEAYFRIAAETIQVHGGIGFTWDHRAHLYFRRAKSSEVILGTPAIHRRKLVQRLEVAAPA